VCTKRNADYCVQLVDYQSTSVQALFIELLTNCAQYSPVADAQCTGDIAKSCRGSVNKVLNLGGCCFTDLMAFANGACWLFPLVGQTAPQLCGLLLLDYFLLNPNCGANLPDRCGANTWLLLELVVANLRWQWCQANPTDCIALIKNAIAAWSGLDDNSLNHTIIATQPAQATSTDLANANLPPNTRRLLEVTDGITITLQIPSTIGSFIITKPNGTVTDATVSAVSSYGDPLTVTTLSSTVTGSASSIVPSLMLLAMLAAALLL
jgi:hypothetical protein